jgi:hypothetical protein
MTYRIIAFESYRRQHASPSRISSIGSQATLDSPGRSTRILKLQVARIARLLDELENVARISGNLPQAIAGRRYAGRESACGDLPSCPGLEGEAGHDDFEVDPQPDIDGDMLERMYRQLDPDA